MKTFGFILISIALILQSQGQAPPLAIEPAVMVTFDTTNDRLYQVEASKQVTPDVWAPVGSSHIGNGDPVSEAIASGGHQSQFFRTQSYNLTNALAAYFPVEQGLQDLSGNRNSINASSIMVNRFGRRLTAARLSGLSAQQIVAHAVVSSFASSTNDFTISLWARGDNYPGPPDKIFVAVTNKLSLMVTVGALDLIVDTVSVAKSQPLIWESTRWYNFHVVRENGVFSVYRDADLVAQGNSAFRFASKPWEIRLGPSYGAVDEVRFYNRALPYDEVGAHSRIVE